MGTVSVEISVFQIVILMNFIMEVLVKNVMIVVEIVQDQLQIYVQVATVHHFYKEIHAIF